MTRWTEIPQKFGLGLRPWQIAYMVLFAVFGTLANLYNGSDITVLIMCSYVYILLSIGSLGVLLPHFRRTLFRKGDPLRRHGRTRRGLVAGMAWRLYLYILVPAFFIAILEAFSAIISVLIRFGQSNVPNQPGVLDYLTGVLAGTEEMWRWSMIGTVLVVLHMLSRQMWHRASVRAVAFTIAFGLSSLSFGAGHILEFETHRLRALFLFSGLGALLALMTIITGRIVLVMCVHMLYDIWVTYLAGADEHTGTVFGLMLYVALLVAPLVTLLWRRHIFSRSRIWQ
ncbi:hypothetical protein AAC03nite_01270 [Alicyclobacillus acidoterrestris]|uniref:hypothetical protein n=1 Tax=Alicyclobacillus suci TaxID=2816080 RepID=UPI001192DA20|nr:hypothetical protein [Alicyclobacillus suci]GEO24342.1 hypothetical protein AAC03nite_01270 [Alicyclobacillus acidoterrestris]